jgi:hypothetical protein
MRALFTPKFDFGFGSTQHRIELEYVGYGLDISQYCIGLKCNGYISGLLKLNFWNLSNTFLKGRK